MWKRDATGAFYRVDNIVSDSYVLTVRLASSDMDPSWGGFVNLFYKTPCGEIMQFQVGFIDEDELEVAQDFYDNYYLPKVTSDPKAAMLEAIQL